MSQGGKRENSGRKKLGNKQVKIVLSEDIIAQINKFFSGNTQADKIRQCIIKGLNCKESD
jgi:hypothetical protein